MLAACHSNPVSHWAHLELQRIFSIDLLLNQANAKEIWEETRQQLKNNSNLSVRNILKKFRVETVCTTDDPSSDLLIHQKMAQDSQATTQVLPTFRPDNAFKINDPSALKAWLKTLSDQPIKTLTDLLEYLTQRHQYFHETGCRLSDHGMAFCPQSAPDLKRAEKTFEQALNNQAISREENDTYQATILHHIAQLNTEKSWTMQLHLGSIRNNSRRYFKGIGVDSGFDSMGNWQQTNRLIAFLSQLEANNILPKIVVYNLNPNESESICCALQSFQTNAATPGSIQYGAAWWHLDHKRGMNNQLEILSSLGVLGTFVGMLTDSRSFTSCVRHEYFRRLLCQFIGQGIENGEIADHPSTVDVVKNIAYYNAKNFFKF